jgi:SecD/SecF fusion protein
MSVDDCLRRDGIRPMGIAVGIFLALMMFCSGCKPRPPAHGVEFLVEIHGDGIRDEDYRRTVESLRRRVETFSRSGAFLAPASNNQVRIRAAFPTEVHQAHARRMLTNSAVLEFRLVLSASSDLVKRGDVPPGYEQLGERQLRTGSTGPIAGSIRLIETFVVSKAAAGGLTSRAIESAKVSRDNLGRPQIDFQLSPKGTELFAEITRTNIGRRLAVVMNGEVLSAPTIVAPIQMGSVTLTGDFNRPEAFELASLLENPLNAPVTIVEERSF